MATRAFLGLEATEDPHRFRLELTRRLLTPGEFLFGGCGLAIAVESMESAAGKPIVWATAQYLDHARMPADLDVGVTLAKVGKSVTQARCTIWHAEREILTAQGALGRRESELGGQFVQMPDVPGPDECEARPLPERFHDTVMAAMEMRIAKGRLMTELDGTVDASGHSALWVRLPGGHRLITSADLAIIGDHMPAGIGQTLGVFAGGSSLDNTIRVIDHAETEWVLVDTHVSAVTHGLGHGFAHLWAEDGTLLATASQTSVVRAFPPELFSAEMDRHG